MYAYVPTFAACAIPCWPRARFTRAGHIALGAPLTLHHQRQTPFGVDFGLGDSAVPLAHTGDSADRTLPYTNLAPIVKTLDTKVFRLVMHQRCVRRQHVETHR